MSGNSERIVSENGHEIINENAQKIYLVNFY